MFWVVRCIRKNLTLYLPYSLIFLKVPRDRSADDHAIYEDQPQRVYWKNKLMITHIRILHRCFELHWSIFKISLYLAIIIIVRMIKRKCLKSQAVDWKGKCTCSVHREILNRQSHIVLLNLKNLTSLTRSLKSHLGCEKVQIYDTTMCNDKDHRAKKFKDKKVGM